jgi:hypothetical protein
MPPRTVVCTTRMDARSRVLSRSRRWRSSLVHPTTSSPHPAIVSYDASVATPTVAAGPLSRARRSIAAKSKSGIPTGLRSGDADPRVRRTSFSARSRTAGSARFSPTAVETHERLVAKRGSQLAKSGEKRSDEKSKSLQIGGLFAARPEEFESPTFGSVDRRSIQLSYGREVAKCSRGNGAGASAPGRWHFPAGSDSWPAAASRKRRGRDSNPR